MITWPRDLPYGETPLVVVWRKRRWRCRRVDCAQDSFTEQIAQLPARARTTGRLRRAVAVAVEAGRSVAEVANAHGLRWPTVQRAVDARAELALGEPAPTPLLGIDETLFSAVRWVRAPHGSWVRVEPRETGFVDLRCPRREGDQGLLGQVAGRGSRSVLGWLTARSEAFRDTIEVVALNPSAPYATAMQAALPQCSVDGLVNFGSIIRKDRASAMLRPPNSSGSSWSVSSENLKSAGGRRTD